MDMPPAGTIRKSVILLLVFTAGAVLCVGIVHGEDPFDKEEILSEWIYGYYHHRDAGSLVPAVRAMDRFEMIGHGYPEKDAFAIGFLSAVFSEYAGRIGGWLAELNDLPFPGARAVVLSAAAASNTPQAVKALNEIASRSDPQAGQFIGSLLSAAPGDFLTMPVEYPSACDLLWGRYFATGDGGYVRRVIEVLAPAGQATELDDKAATVEAAGRYLVIYAGMYLDVMAICEEELRIQPEETRKRLEEIIAKARRSPLK